MATAPVTPNPAPQGAPDPNAGGGAPDPNAQGGGQQSGGVPEPVRMMAAIARLAQQISQTTAAVSPEMQQITQLAQTSIRKFVIQSQQQQPQAPPL